MGDYISDLEHIRISIIDPEDRDIFHPHLIMVLLGSYIPVLGWLFVGVFAESSANLSYLSCFNSQTL